jgi:ankyrin repeat protein/WD40 repeat protein
MQVVDLNPDKSGSDEEGQDGGGVMISFVNGQVIREKVPKLKSGPLFDYLLKVSNGNPAIDIDTVKKYIAESPVDFVNPIFGNYTALFLIAQSRHITEEVLDLLLDAGYNKEAVDSWGKTALLEALMNNNVVIAKRLIERGANINHAAPSGNALSFAVRSGNTDLMKMLLEKGVDLNFVSANGELAINEAISNNNIEIAKYLLTQKIQPIALNSTPEKPLFNPPLCAAVASDNLELVDLVLEAGADINGYGDEKLTPLILALWRRELHIVQRLFEKGAKPSDLPMDEMFIAARNKVPEAMQKLIDLGADVKKTYKGRSLVNIGMGSPHIDTGNSERISWEQQERNQVKFQAALDSIGDLVKLLGKYGLDFNASPAEDPTLIPLLQAQNVEVFKLVESFGASLTVNIQGSTLLHLMMDAAMTDILEYVLEKGVIDINAKNSEGMSALHLACKVLEAPDQYSRAEDLTPNVELLIKYKADINILNNDNQTPLMFALAQQNLDAARVLVRNGAKLEVKDKNGNNLIHTACSLQEAGENLLALITKHADFELLKKWMSEKNNEGETPADVAKKNDNEGLVLLLKGDLLGAASKGVLIFDFAKLQPEAIQKLERGYECHEVDTSKYDLNTGQTSSFFKLASEVVASILVHASVDDLVSFSMVCRQFKQWSENSNIWKFHLKREYGTDAKTQSPKKELAVKWRTQVNMRKGIFLSRALSLTPEVETPKEIEGYANPHHAGVASMDFDPQSGMLFVGDLKYSISCVDVKNAALKKTIKVTKIDGDEYEGSRVQGMTVVPNDKTLLYHMGSGRLLARNYETDVERQITASCRDLSVSGDFALTANYKTYELYNWKTGENLWSFVEGDSSYTVLLKDNIAITGTGANGDTKVRFYDINTKTKIAESAGQSYATYLTGSKKYAVGTASKLIECFEIATGKSLWRHKDAHTGLSITHVAIDEEAMMVVSVSNAELFAWDLLTGKQLAKFTEQPEESQNGWSAQARQYLSLATKGHLIFAGVADRKSEIEVWDVRRPQAPLYVVPLTAGPKCMVVKDNYVLAGLMNDSIKIVNFNV